jgi:allantoate deiminase
MAGVDAARAVAGLQELRRRTEDSSGAQRVAWTDTWIAARDWLRSELDGIERFLIIGGHLDSVPNGGWLDGTLNVVGGLEVLRELAGEPRPLTVKLVDWADEEGARFGRSLFGSSAAAGTLDPDAVRGLTDRDGTRLEDAVAAYGVDLDRAPEARERLDGAVAYLELHIEQGPVLEQMGIPLGVVLGTFGVQRHMVRFTGAHAHAGATPMRMRRDAFLAAARSALAWREDARTRRDVRATTGIVNVSPGIVTAFNGRCEVSLDQRALDPVVLADMLSEAFSASEKLAAAEDCSVEWEQVWEIEPIPFDDALVELADAVVQEVAGTSHRLPSGPLHDAAEMARVIPTVMLFVKSLGGVSHTKDEDTPVEDLELSVRALYELARRTLARAA